MKQTPLFRSDYNSLNFDHMMNQINEEEINGMDDALRSLTEYRGFERRQTPEMVRAAARGDLDAYFKAAGMEGPDTRDPFKRKFMELTLPQIAHDHANKAQAPRAKSAKSPLAKRTMSTKPGKARYKGPSKRGFGYLSLSKALKRLAGGPKSTKARLERAVGTKLYSWLMDAVSKAKPVRMGKRGKPLKKRGPLSAKSAAQIGGKFFGKMSKAYPFSDKSGRSPKNRDERVMNKAHFIRGLSLAYQLLASNVGRADKAAAKIWLGDKKKKLRLFEWQLMRDLEYLGEDIYATFMALVEGCERELEECIDRLDVLEEGSELEADYEDLCDTIDMLSEGKQSQEARELELYINNNDDAPYRQKRAIFKNLAKKKKKGRYDRKLAVKGMMHAVDNGARAYTKEHGSPGSRPKDIFPRSARTEVANAFVDEFEDEHDIGNVDESVWIDEDDREYYGEDAPDNGGDYLFERATKAQIARGRAKSRDAMSREISNKDMAVAYGGGALSNKERDDMQAKSGRLKSRLKKAGSGGARRKKSQTAKIGKMTLNQVMPGWRLKLKAFVLATKRARNARTKSGQKAGLVAIEYVDIFDEMAKEVIREYSPKTMPGNKQQRIQTILRGISLAGRHLARWLQKRYKSKAKRYVTSTMRVHVDKLNKVMESDNVGYYLQEAIDFAFSIPEDWDGYGEDAPEYIDEGKVKDGFKWVFGKLVKIAKDKHDKAKRDPNSKYGAGARAAEKAAELRRKKAEWDDLPSVAYDPAYFDEVVLEGAFQKIAGKVAGAYHGKVKGGREKTMKGKGAGEKLKKTRDSQKPDCEHGDKPIMTFGKWKCASTEDTVKKLEKEYNSLRGAAMDVADRYGDPDEERDFSNRASKVAGKIAKITGKKFMGVGEDIYFDEAVLDEETLVLAKIIESMDESDLDQFLEAIDDIEYEYGHDEDLYEEAFDELIEGWFGKFKKVAKAAGKAAFAGAKQVAKSAASAGAAAGAKHDAEEKSRKEMENNAAVAGSGLSKKGKVKRLNQIKNCKGKVKTVFGTPRCIEKNKKSRSERKKSKRRKVMKKIMKRVNKKRNKKSGRRGRRNKAAAYNPAYFDETVLNEDLRLNQSDKKVIRAFLNGQALSSNKLSTNGRSLDINGMGGKGAATRRDNGMIALHDLGSRSGETVHRAVKKLAPGGMVEGKDLMGMLRSRLPSEAKVKGQYEKGVYSYEEAAKYLKMHGYSSAKIKKALAESTKSDLSMGYLLGEGLTTENIDAVDKAIGAYGLLNETTLTLPAEYSDGRSARSLAEGHDYHKLGAELQHWNKGEGSPVHKVGSMLFAGRKPWRKDVCDAVEELQAMMMSPSYGEHEQELRSIISRLRSVCLG